MDTSEQTRVQSSNCWNEIKERKREYEREKEKRKKVSPYQDAKSHLNWEDRRNQNEKEEKWQQLHHHNGITMRDVGLVAKWQ